MTVEQRVAKGAQLLDQHRPGWRDSIKPQTLNIDSCRDCVLGQVFGSYYVGLVKLWPTNREDGRYVRPSDYGFANLFTASHETAQSLHATWRAEVQRVPVAAAHTDSDLALAGD